MAPNIHVLIVGGGIGGLMLGIMLERAGIEYQILERSSEHRPLGSAICMNGTVLRIFEQLGLLEELYKISKFAGRLHLAKEDMTTLGHVDLEHFHERYGYHSIVFGRPDLFKLLVAHIPDGRILMSKRVLSTSQTEEGILVRCSDGSIYHGDILVGADGAYSSVRQCMHKSLKDKGLLPRSDSQQLKFDQHCVVGITDEMDPEKYLTLKDKVCELYGIVGNKRPYTLWLIPIVGNRFAWSIGGRTPDSEVGQEDVRSFSFAEWWPELATDVCDLVRDYSLPDFKTPYHQNEHYKNTTLPDHPHKDHHASDNASVSDNSSCHSAVRSDSAPVSSASSVCAEEHGTSHPKGAHGVGTIGGKGYLSPLSEPLHQTHTFTNGSNASTTSSSTTDASHRHGPKRPTPPPAKPGTVAEILDATPTDRISKVMLESKLFKVWHHERTVLIGDACHKVLPFTGQGAIQAILDSIALANALYDMTSGSIDDVTKAFKTYSNERIPIAKGAVTGSRSMGKLLNVQSKLLDFVRKISFSHVPTWILKMATDRLHLYRPQLTYLPMVPDRGTAKAHKQDYSPKYLKKLELERCNRREQEASVVAANAAFNGAQEKGEFEHDHDHDHDHDHGHSARHRRAHPSALSQDAYSTRKMSSRSLVTVSDVPPPLPPQGPPRHHPTVYLHQHPEDKIGVIPSPARSCSTFSSPTSSSHSLNTGLFPEELNMRQPRCRRQTHSGRAHTSSRATSCTTSCATSRATSRERVPLPISLPPSYDTHEHLPMRSPHHPSESNISSVHTFSPPRSPVTKPHRRNIEDSPLSTQILALEQTTALILERAALQDQRSLEQLNLHYHTQREQNQQRHPSDHQH
ncbi:hypothetical protein BG011_002725 [Mortierella polycephala]|uniref:FAD-binding domain-containing protein n=1 Tax=Mortierella polycephala TaxID=41804 RepID=A0A9P6Q2N8_9FUNG|nr:hypothetical protein BG011_002725 [Mortierella polycephala]